MRNAGIALDRARQLGKGQVEGFDADLGRKTERRNEYKRDLLDALGRDQFHLVYQPIVRLSDGRTVGAEALLRWDHHVYGNVLPADFIALAEQTGVMIPIGQWVLDQACASAMGWADSSMFVAVNVSGMELRDTGVVGAALRSLRQSGLAADRLVLDVNEAALLDDNDEGSERLAQLRDIGVRTALDDFGSGYSSLAYVRRLPLDIIKIDRELVQTIDDPRSNALADTIINMARNLGLRTIAEGVETETQAVTLAKLGCDLAQGHLFFKPLSPVAMTALVDFERQPADGTLAPPVEILARAPMGPPLPPPSATALAEVPPLPAPDVSTARTDPTATPSPPIANQDISHLLRPLLS
jgi:EAL domain-containing protein (putative c-di-GMP-specific phosphodiesterase class I)